MKILAQIVFDEVGNLRPGIPDDISFSIVDGEYEVGDVVEVTILAGCESDPRLSEYEVTEP